MILIVIWVVLMMFWLFAGYTAAQPSPPTWAPLSNTLIPWLCVAILGWIMFNGMPGAPIK